MIGYLKNYNILFKQDLKEVLDDTLYEATREEAIDYYNRFIGQVTNNNDPDKIGKCQIRVLGLFGSEISDSDLPYFLPEFDFVGSKKGNFIVPLVGTYVNCYFVKGDIYSGIYTTAVTDLNNLPSRRMKNYPDNMVFFETDRGDYLEMDRKTSTTTFQHSSGSKIIIYSNGNIEINSVGKQLTIKSADTCSVAGNNFTNIGGNGTGTNPVLYGVKGTVPTVNSDGTISGIFVSTTVGVGA